MTYPCRAGCARSGSGRAAIGVGARRPRWAGWRRSACSRRLAPACAGCHRAARVRGRFDLEHDAFAFANLVRAERPGWNDAFANYCLVIARAASQFYRFARFAPDRPAGLARRSTSGWCARSSSRPPWAPPAPEADRAVIPGYADLHSFSAAHEAVIKTALGSNVLSMMHWRTWRVGVDFLAGAPGAARARADRRSGCRPSGSAHDHELSARRPAQSLGSRLRPPAGPAGDGLRWPTIRTTRARRSRSTTTTRPGRSGSARSPTVRRDGCGPSGSTPRRSSDACWSSPPRARARPPPMGHAVGVTDARPGWTRPARAGTRIPTTARATTGWRPRRRPGCPGRCGRGSRAAGEALARERFPAERAAVRRNLARVQPGLGTSLAGRGRRAGVRALRRVLRRPALVEPRTASRVSGATSPASTARSRRATRWPGDAAASHITAHLGNWELARTPARDAGPAGARGDGAGAGSRRRRVARARCRPGVRFVRLTSPTVGVELVTRCAEGRSSRSSSTARGGAAGTGRCRSSARPWCSRWARS